MTDEPALVVPDASVILKWVLPSDDEPDADEALTLLAAFASRKIRFVVPSLWRFEVGNTIARRFPDEAAVWLDTLDRLGLDEIVPTGRWLAATLSLTRTHGVSFYDAAYHAAAVELEGVLVTADERYVAKVPESGAVRRLSRWNANGLAGPDDDVTSNGSH